MFKFLLFLGLVAFLQAKSIHNDLEWEEFKLKYAKNYAENGEEQVRKDNFFKNKALVLEHNNGENGKLWSAGLNKYSDMSWEEFDSIMNGFKPELKKPSNEVFRANKDFQPPKELDYRKKGFVTGAKDQGTCGSCWSFSATGALEGQLYRVNKTLVSLSEQNLIDCSKKYKNNGCHGGNMDSAFEYIKDNHGIDTEASYPYEGVDNKACRYNKKNKGGEDFGFVDIESESDDALLQALVEKGPISIAIFADINFKLYKKGIFENKNCIGKKLNHGILLVGHGVDEETGKKYWLVKNSWGTQWGEDGFGKISREIKNNCGISTMASYPKV